MEKANYVVDLHSHTNRSDGADTPFELIMHGKERGMKIMVITDHDVVPPTVIDTDNGPMDVVEFAASQGIKLIPGIEVSCETYVDEVHLVCFGCDWEDPYFVKMQADVVDSKVESYRLLVERLAEDGHDVSWEEVLDNNGHPISEDQVQKKMIFELMGRKGVTPDWSEAKLLVKATPRYSIQRRKPDPIEVIKEAHRCGGIVIMAHPFLVGDVVDPGDGEMTRYDYIERLIDAGLDGIEACYAYDKTSYKGEMTKAEIEEYILKTYKDRLPIISGGSDYHADQKKGAKKVREVGECGITEELFYSTPLLAQLVD